MKTWLRGLALALPLSAVAFTFGCGSSSNSAGTDAGTSGDTGGTSAPTFTDVYTKVIMTNSCTLHHAPPTLSGGLDMSTQAKAYSDLVGVPATTPAGETPACTGDRVVAGDAASSLLYEKVSEAKPPCGAQMPLGLTPISAADMTMIKDWINAGAKNN
jgi:hypothetical protein